MRPAEQGAGARGGGGAHAGGVQAGGMKFLPAANDRRADPGADDQIWPRWLLRPKWRTDQAAGFSDDVRLMEMKLAQDPQFAVVLEFDKIARVHALSGKIHEVMRGLSGRPVRINQLLADRDGVMGEVETHGIVETFRINRRG